MKTNELVKKLNAIDGVFATYQNDKIVIGPHKLDDFFINVPIDATSFLDLDIFVTSPGLYFPKNVREIVSALVYKFLTTPVDERLPEKKYRLMAMRYVEGPIAIKQYVTGFQASGDYVTFDYGNKENAEEWTDKELHNLSQWFPREAIDAMKEPAEDE